MCVSAQRKWALSATSQSEKLKVTSSSRKTHVELLLVCSKGVHTHACISVFVRTVVTTEDHTHSGVVL